LGRAGADGARKEKDGKNEGRAHAAFV
jgi:hypothetical protein